MNIVCENCNTVYRFDATKIPPGGKKVKCSHCQHIFIAMPMDEEAALRTLEPDLEPAGEDSDSEAEPDVGSDVQAGRKAEGESAEKRKQRLLLRQDGTRYAVSDLATLQRWIVERRVTREAELSMDGEVWEKVAERMDLLPFFSIVEKSRSKKKSKTSGDAPAPAGPREKREKPQRPGREEAAVTGLRVATTLQAAAGQDLAADGDDPASVSLDPALQAATGVGAGEVAPVSEANDDDRPAPVIAMNRVSPAEAAPSTGTARAAETHAGGTNTAARAIYAVTFVVLLAGGGYAARTRLFPSGPEVTPPPAMASVSGPGTSSAGGTNAGPRASSAGGTNAGPGASSTGESPSSVGSTGSPALPGGAPNREDGAAGGNPGGAAPTGGDGTRAAPGGGEPPGGGTSPGTAPGKAAPAGDGAGTGGATVRETTAAVKPPGQGGTPSVVKSTPAPAPRAPDRPAAPETKPKPEAVASIERPEAPGGKLAIAVPSGTPGRLLQAGRDAINRHKFDLAVATLKKARDGAPTNPVIHKELARALLNLADDNYTQRAELQGEAVAACKRAVELNGSYAEAYHLMGVAQMSLGQKAEAANNLRAALKYGLKGDDATEVRSFLNQLEGEGAGSN